MTDPELSRQEVAKRWKKYKETKKVILKRMKEGWTITQGSKYATLWCPHHGDGRDKSGSTQVWKTPTNDFRYARRLKSMTGHCPDRHDLLH